MANERQMSILEHLDELRRRLVWSAVALVIATGLCFSYGYKLLLNAIRGPLDALDPNTTNPFAAYNPLVTLMRPILMGKNEIAALPLGDKTITTIPLYASTFMETFVVKFKLALLGGAILAAPFIFYQLWAFIGSGLLVREKRVVLKFLPLSLALFVIGLAFGYFGAMPMALMYLLTVDSNVKIILMIGDYVGTMLIMLAMFGLAFQLPLVAMALARLGIMPAASLARSRRYAIVLIFIVAAIITPSPEPFSQCLLAIPMCLLYEMGIWLARAAEKGANK